MTINCKGSDIKYFAGYICVPSPAEQQGEVVADKDYTVTIKLQSKKRSLNANAYYWELAGKLARCMNIPALEVYRRHIVDMSTFNTICIPTKGLKSFKAQWNSDHYGRRIETRESRIDGCTVVLAYYGSSDFDAAEMARLIDNCIQDCKALGIETRPQEEIDSLLQQWKEAKEKEAEDAKADQSDEHPA